MSVVKCQLGDSASAFKYASPDQVSSVEAMAFPAASYQQDRHLGPTPSAPRSTLAFGIRWSSPPKCSINRRRLWTLVINRSRSGIRHRSDHRRVERPGALRRASHAIDVAQKHFVVSMTQTNFENSNSLHSARTRTAMSCVLQRATFDIHDLELNELSRSRPYRLSRQDETHQLPATPQTCATACVSRISHRKIYPRMLLQKL